MKHFCSICGKPTIYALTPPKFCSQCGDDFSVVTKQKDKSVHDQALEKAKDKYEVNTPKFVPQPKPEPKNYPNPARASFKLINEGHTEIRDDDEEYDADDTSATDDNDNHGDHHIDASKFHRIKPKFKIQSFGSNSESFESLLTQGHASNYKSADPREIRNVRDQGPRLDTNPDSILEEFKREAGSLRNQQD
jgi:hypothetical protein